MQVEYVMDLVRHVSAIDLDSAEIDEAMSDLWEAMQKLDGEVQLEVMLAWQQMYEARAVSQKFFQRFIRRRPGQREI